MADSEEFEFINLENQDRFWDQEVSSPFEASFVHGRDDFAYCRTRAKSPLSCRGEAGVFEQSRTNQSMSLQNEGQY